MAAVDAMRYPPESIVYLLQSRIREESEELA